MEEAYLKLEAENLKLTEENERLKDRVLVENNLRHQVEEMLANGMGVVKADTAKKTLDAVRSRATRNAYSCMISGDIRETYTISGKALEEIEKELLEGENEKNTNII